MKAVSRYGQASVMDLSLSKEGGKSGQRRVPHHLTDGSRYCGNRQCHRNYTVTLYSVIRVKTCGKSARGSRATGFRDKPCGLKCHVHFNSPIRFFVKGYPAARGNVKTIEGGRQLEPCQ